MLFNKIVVLFEESHFNCLRAMIISSKNLLNSITDS